MERFLKRKNFEIKGIFNFNCWSVNVMWFAEGIKVRIMEFLTFTKITFFMFKELILTINILWSPLNRTMWSRGHWIKHICGHTVILYRVYTIHMFSIHLTILKPRKGRKVSFQVIFLILITKPRNIQQYFIRPWF